MKKNQDEKIINRVDKFLFRLQSQILSLLLPEIKSIIKERESDYREAVVENSNKEGN